MLPRCQGIASGGAAVFILLVRIKRDALAVYSQISRSILFQVALMSSGCLGLTLQEEEAKADRAASAAATEDELEALEDALADAEAADLGNPYLDGMEEDEEGDFEGRREETFVWLLSAPPCRSSSSPSCTN